MKGEGWKGGKRVEEREESGREGGWEGMKGKDGKEERDGGQKVGKINICVLYHK